VSDLLWGELRTAKVDPVDNRVYRGHRVAPRAHDCGVVSQSSHDARISVCVGATGGELSLDRCYQLELTHDGTRAAGREWPLRALFGRYLCR
jgi:hypothetical protein